MFTNGGPSFHMTNVGLGTGKQRHMRRHHMSKLNNYVVKVKQTSVYLIEAETSNEAKRHVDWLYSRLDMNADKYTVEVKSVEVPEGGLDKPDPMDDQEEFREQLNDLIREEKDDA